MSEVRYLVHPYETDAPERIWVWGWQASCGWQEQTWQLEDEPISAMPYVRADMLNAAEQRGYASAMEAERKLHEARIEELEAKLAKAVEALDEAWFMLTVPHLNYEPEPEEPGLRRIKTALAELKEETHE